MTDETRTQDETTTTTQDAPTPTRVLLPRALLQAMALLTSKDPRYGSAIGHVQIRPDGSVHATDGSMLGRGRARYPTPASDFPLVEPEGAPLTTPVYATPDVIAKVVKHTPRKTPIPVLTEIRVSATETTVDEDGQTSAPRAMLAATDRDVPVVLTAPGLDGYPFPNTDRITVDETDARRVFLNVALLEIIVKVAKGIGAKSVEVTVPQAEVDADGRQTPISTPCGWYVQSHDVEIDGVIMPMR